MVDFKKVKAPNNTITRNPASLASKADNIYEAVAVIGKRANQISVEMKEELSRKLQEFASYADNLEEIFENREQIEISKYYERLPKPVLIATQEFEDGDIYFRVSSKEKGDANNADEEESLSLRKRIYLRVLYFQVFCFKFAKQVLFP